MRVTRFASAIVPLNEKCPHNTSILLADIVQILLRGCSYSKNTNKVVGNICNHSDFYQLFKAEQQ